ncbi:helix-turn-helix transcriptional regulator [Rhodopirellula bahusiensis]|uniref:helix-turn-helix transcriptional regulator n=1 Tax=Rhodopirellula bahusiensis TaxID=2014065 RepID=UPI00326358FA
MTRQLDLLTDLPRGQQLQALRRIKLDSWKVGKASVSGAIQKSVLRAIDDHDGGRGSWATQETLADELGISRASIGRAIAALIDRDLITKERKNHWSPNTQRINWTALHQLDASTTHSDASTATCDAPRPLRDSGPLPQGEFRNASETQIETPPSEWAGVVEMLQRWGCRSAAVAVEAARQRGWSADYVRELFIDIGGDGDAEHWQPGALANVLTGKTPPQFDEHEAAQRAADRIDGPAKREADEIRQSVQRDGLSRGVAEFIIEGLTFRKLAAIDLDRFATDAEQTAAVRLDELDRERSEKPSRSVNARSGSVPNAIDEPQNRERATASHMGRQRQDAANQPRVRTENRGLFQRIPSGNRGTRAFDRKRAELVSALDRKQTN